MAIVNTTTAEKPVPEAPQWSIADVKREYFPPAAKAKGIDAYINLDDKLPASQLFTNIKFAENEAGEFEPVMHEGFGIAVIPLQKRSGVKDQPKITYGIAVAQVPDVEMLAADDNEKGQKWIVETVRAALEKKVTDAARPAANGKEISLPVSLADFIEGRKSAKEAMRWFALTADDAITFLQKKSKRGFEFMNKDLLRLVLSNAALAKSQYPVVSQDAWDGLLRKMVEAAKKLGADTSVGENWLATRNEKSLEQAVDFDAEEFGEMLEEEDEEDEEEEEDEEAAE